VGKLWSAVSPGTLQRSWAVAPSCQEQALGGGGNPNPMELPPATFLETWPVPSGGGICFGPGLLGWHPGAARLTLVNDGPRELALGLLPTPWLAAHRPRDGVSDPECI